MTPVSVWVVLGWIITVIGAVSVWVTLNGAYMYANDCRMTFKLAAFSTLLLLVGLTMVGVLTL